jgi:hypothetical protein
MRRSLIVSRDLEGSDFAFLKAEFRYLAVETDENLKTSVRVAGNFDEIRT